MTDSKLWFNYYEKHRITYVSVVIALSGIGATLVLTNAVVLAATLVAIFGMGFIIVDRLAIPRLLARDLRKQGAAKDPEVVAASTAVLAAIAVKRAFPQDPRRVLEIASQVSGRSDPYLLFLIKAVSETSEVRAVIPGQC